VVFKRNKHGLLPVLPGVAHEVLGQGRHVSDGHRVAILPFIEGFLDGDLEDLAGDLVRKA